MIGYIEGIRYRLSQHHHIITAIPHPHPSPAPTAQGTTHPMHLSKPPTNVITSTNDKAKKKKTHSRPTLLPKCFPLYAVTTGLGVDNSPTLDAVDVDTDP
jgi:hypothetical protein